MLTAKDTRTRTSDRKEVYGVAVVDGALTADVEQSIVLRDGGHDSKLNDNPVAVQQGSAVTELDAKQRQAQSAFFSKR